MGLMMQNQGLCLVLGNKLKLMQLHMYNIWILKMDSDSCPAGNVLT